MFHASNVKMPHPYSKILFLRCTGRLQDSKDSAGTNVRSNIENVVRVCILLGGYACMADEICYQSIVSLIKVIAGDDFVTCVKPLRGGCCDTKNAKCRKPKQDVHEGVKNAADGRSKPFE
jgi:hypothetical protein